MGYQTVRALVVVSHDGVDRKPGVTSGKNAQDFVVSDARAATLIAERVVVYVGVAAEPRKVVPMQMGVGEDSGGEAAVYGPEAVAVNRLAQKNRPLAVVRVGTSFAEEELDDQLTNARESSILSRSPWGILNALEGNPTFQVWNGGRTNDTFAQIYARRNNTGGGYTFGKSSAPGYLSAVGRIFHLTAPQNDFAAGTSTTAIQASAFQILDDVAPYFDYLLVDEQPALGPNAPNWVSSIRDRAIAYNTSVIAAILARYPGKAIRVPLWKYSLDPSSGASMFGFANYYRTPSHDHWRNRGAILAAYPALKEALTGIIGRPPRILAGTNAPILTRNMPGVQLQSDPFFQGAVQTSAGGAVGSGTITVGSQFPLGVSFNGTAGVNIVDAAVVAAPSGFGNMLLVRVAVTGGTAGTTNLQVFAADSQANLATLGIDFTSMVGGMEVMMWGDQDIRPGGVPTIPTTQLQESGGLMDVSPNLRTTTDALVGWRRGLQTQVTPATNGNYGPETFGKVFEVITTEGDIIGSNGYPGGTATARTTVLRTGAYIWPQTGNSAFVVGFACPSIVKHPSRYFAQA